MAAFGDLLRARRKIRRLSQLDLSLEAGISARHLAFLETGRARPSREMVRRLARALRTPLVVRNRLLTAAGFAAEHPQRCLDDPALSAARMAMSRLLTQQEPYPALVLDHRWTVLDANRASERLFAPLMAFEGRNLIAFLIETPAFRDSIENWVAIGPEMLARLRVERAEGPEDPELDRLLERLEQVVAESGGDAAPAGESDAAFSDGLFLCPRFRFGDQTLSLFSTIARFGAPWEVSISDLQIELFFPLDPETDAFLQAIADA